MPEAQGGESKGTKKGKKTGKGKGKGKGDGLTDSQGMVRFNNPLDGRGSMKLGDTKRRKKKLTGSGDSQNDADTDLLSADYLTRSTGSFDFEVETEERDSKSKNGKKGKKGKKKKKGEDVLPAALSRSERSVDDESESESEPETEPGNRQYSQDEIDRWKKKSVTQLQRKALDKGVSENAVLDAGNSKNKLIDLIVHGDEEDDMTWTQKATAKRYRDKNAAMFKQKSSSTPMFKQKSAINMDFHTFESDAPDADAHFVKIEEAGEEVTIVDYWLDDPEENYIPCTNNNGGLNPDCIWYSLTCPCFWRVAWDSLPTWENQDPDPDDLQQMLVYDDVNSKRIYMLAPRPNESMHSAQCRNACLYQKLHHPIISIFTTHQFNELSKFEKVLVFILGYFLSCFLTEGMEKALGLELEEFFGIPAIATFLFFKLFTAIASIPADLLLWGFPVGKFTDMALPLAIRGAFGVFVMGMVYGGVVEQKLVILNLCQFTMIFHDSCDYGLQEVFVAALLDLLKGMTFEFMLGFTLVFRPRFLRFELFGFCPPSIPGEMYQAHHKTEFINERGNQDYYSAWRKPWPYGDKGRALVNWMEIRPETQKVAERQKELYIKGTEYAKEQDLKKSKALAKEVEALMSVEEVDRQLKREDMRRANQMHEQTKMNALELLKTSLENINNELDADVRAAQAIVPGVQSDIKAEIKAVKRHANARANEAGPGFFDRRIFYRKSTRKKKLAAVKAIRDEAAADVEMMETEAVQRLKVATSQATAARIAADDKWMENTHAAHKRLKAMEDEAYGVYEAHITAAEEESHKRTKKQKARADKAEAQANAAAEEMEAKRQREEALDRNKDRLREENRAIFEDRLEKLLEGEAQMALERARDQWISAIIETGQKYLDAKAGTGVWRHVTPPPHLFLWDDYEQRHIAELHRKVDDAMVSLGVAYKQREGAQRHKEVMIQMATPKHMPKRRQKQLRLAAEKRIEDATREGDNTIAKMHEHVLSWKAVALTGLEKMAAEQDELMKVAEKELEELQELAKETAQVIMGFGGKIADVIEMEKFQDPQGYRAELSRQKEEAERVSAEEEDDSKKSKKNVKKEKKKKKKEAEAEEEQEEEEEEQEAINLATPYLKKLRGTAALTKMVEKERLRERAEQREAAAVAAEEARRKALSELVVKKTDENQPGTPKAGESKSPDKSPPKGKQGNAGKSPSNGTKDQSSNGKKGDKSPPNGKKATSDASSSNGKKGNSDASSSQGKKSK